MKNWFCCNVLFIDGPKYGTCIYCHFIRWVVPSRKLRLCFGLVGRKKWFTVDWEPSNPFRNTFRERSK